MIVEMTTNPAMGPLLHEPVSSGNVVYIAQQEDDGPVKIGESLFLRARLQEVARTCARTLVLVDTMPGDRAREGAIKKHFVEYRLQDEWFAPGPKLLAFARELRCRVDGRLTPPPFEHVVLETMSKEEMRVFAANRIVRPEMWRATIRNALIKEGGHLTRTAARLRVSLQTLQRWIKLDPGIAVDVVPVRNRKATRR